MRSPSGWAKFLRACGAGASRGDLYLLRLALSFIFPYWHYHSSFPIGIIIHLSRLALSFIFPDWHYHSSFPIGIIIHLSRLALSFIFPDWHYHSSFPIGIIISSFSIDIIIVQGSWIGGVRRAATILSLGS